MLLICSCCSAISKAASPTMKLPLLVMNPLPSNCGRNSSLLIILPDSATPLSISLCVRPSSISPDFNLIAAPLIFSGSFSSSRFISASNGRCPKVFSFLILGIMFATQLLSCCASTWNASSAATTSLSNGSIPTSLFNNHFGVKY